MKSIPKQPHRRRGFVVIYLSFSIVVLLGISALVVDLGIAYQKRAFMQKASDTAAMAAAAYAVSNPGAITAAISNTAKVFASTNYGYTDGTNGVTVTVVVTNSATSIGTGNVVVTISKPQPTLFARIFRMKLFSGDTPFVANSMQIGTTATAAYTTTYVVKSGISGSSQGYGVNSLSYANLSLCGPLSTTNRGDKFSSRYTSSDGSNTGTLRPNPYFVPANLRPQDDRKTDFQTQLVAGEQSIQGDGYYFDFTIPASAGRVSVQLYDPGNSTESVDPSTAPINKAWNEINSSNNNTRTPTGTMRAVPTKTRFQAWNDNGTPDDKDDDVRVTGGSALYGETTPDKTWIDSCIIDPSLYPPSSKFYMNATTVDGTGKNGFNVRLNRVNASGVPQDTDAVFSGSGNGTSVSSRGVLPISFGSNGTANLSLGYVPANATSITIKRFDVDVGTPSGGFGITYTSSSTATPPVPTPYPGAFLLGGGSANDVDQTEVITLPAGYAGGNWVAAYSAGQADQSTWMMSYTGPPSSNAVTSIRLTN